MAAINHYTGAREWNRIPCTCEGAPPLTDKPKRESLRQPNMWGVARLYALHVKLGHEAFCPCVHPDSFIAMHLEAAFTNRFPLIMLHTKHPLSALIMNGLAWNTLMCVNVDTPLALLNAVHQCSHLYMARQLSSAIVLSPKFTCGNDLANYELNPRKGWQTGVGVFADKRIPSAVCDLVEAVASQNGLAFAKTPIDSTLPWYVKELDTL